MFAAAVGIGKLSVSIVVKNAFASLTQRYSNFHLYVREYVASATEFMGLPVQLQTNMTHTAKNGGDCCLAASFATAQEALRHIPARIEAMAEVGLQPFLAVT